MKESFELNIFTPEKEIFSGDIVELRSQNENGGFGILPNHIAMVTVLKPAITSFRDASGKNYKVFTSSGVLRVKDNVVNLMCETAEWPEEIDINRAEEAKKRAETRLAQKDNPEIDDKRAELALMKAITRIKIKQQ